MHRNIQTLWREGQVYGLELVVDLLLLILRYLSISYWLRARLPEATEPKRAVRDIVIDAYSIFELIVLLVLLLANPFGPVLNTVIAAYILFEIFLMLLNIIFIGKFGGINAPPASVERSILLFGLNVLQVVVAFFIFYRDWLGLSSVDAFFKAVLVLGTIGYPKVSGNLVLVVALQVFLDLILIVLLIGSFVGNLSLFRERRSRSASRGGTKK